MESVKEEIGLLPFDCYRFPRGAGQQQAAIDLRKRRYSWELRWGDDIMDENTKRSIEEILTGPPEFTPVSEEEIASTKAGFLRCAGVPNGI